MAAPGPTWTSLFPLRELGRDSGLCRAASATWEPSDSCRWWTSPLASEAEEIKKVQAKEATVREGNGEA